MWLYFLIDLTGNFIMIEKLVLGEIWTRDLPIFNPDALTSAPSWQVYESSYIAMNQTSSWIIIHNHESLYISVKFITFIQYLLLFDPNYCLQFHQRSQKK